MCAADWPIASKVALAAIIHVIVPLASNWLRWRRLWLPLSLSLSRAAIIIKRDRRPDRRLLGRTNCR